LVVNTSKYYGPGGSISEYSSGMNCQNCHLEAGTKFWGNNFSAAKSTYPKYKDRRGEYESVTQKVLDCFERSLNVLLSGNRIQHAPDSNSREIKAIVAYIRWLGKNVPKGVKPEGAQTRDLPLLDHKADTAYGRQIFYLKCISCHQKNGMGVKYTDKPGYQYPPLWGKQSYNTGASMYRLSRLAAFIQDNMPFGATYEKPQLNNEEAWDIAAFICSQPREIMDCSKDWPDLGTKFADIAFGPYADTFSYGQHKYGPYGPIEMWRKNYQKKSQPAKQ
jgi:thiosulfate dehydrogenase